MPLHPFYAALCPVAIEDMVYFNLIK